MDRLYRWLRALILRLPGGGWLWQWTDPHFISHSLLRRAVEQHADLLSGRLLDVGCGRRPYADLLAARSQVIGIDLPGKALVDVVASGMSLPFASRCFDSVLCMEVIEHVPEPGRIFAEISRVLKPGGVLLLTTPQTWGLHLEPHDYYRYTPHGLRYLAAQSGLDPLSIEPTSGFWATFAQRMVDMIIYTRLASWHPGRQRWVALMLAPLLMLGVALDKLFGKRGDTLDNVLFAIKPPG